MNRARKALLLLNKKDENQPATSVSPISSIIKDEIETQKENSDGNSERADSSSTEGTIVPAEAQTTEDWDSWDPMDEDYNSPMNTLALNVNEDPVSQITGRVQPISSKIGNVIICDHYAKFGTCADGSYCDRIHIGSKARDKIWAFQSNSDLNKNRQCMNYTYLSPVEHKPDPSSLLLVSITNARSPSMFYFVTPYETKNFAKHSTEDLDFFIEHVATKSSVSIKQQQCHKQLASLFDHPYRIDNVNDDIYLSQIVACKLKDNQFRRAMVIDVPDLFNDKFNYKLLLIDVGIEIELPRESIYDIRAQCLSEPPMAICCRLDIMPAVGSEWSTDALEIFDTEARGEKFWLCKITNYLRYDNMFVVELYHPETRVSLGDRLIESGLAKKCLY